MDAIITDHQARAIVLEAFAQQGITPTMQEIQLVQAVAKHESGYGELLGPQHHNWGAIHCVHGPPCLDGCFQAGDKDAAGHSYPTCMRSYGSDLEGAADLVRELYRRPHVAAQLRTGNIVATAQTMGQPSHGIGAYHQSAWSSYASALYRNLLRIASALNEPLAAYWPAPPPKPAALWPWWVLGGLAAAVVLTRRHIRGRDVHA